MPQLGLPKQQGTNNIQKAPRLGISSNKLNYKDSFTSIDSKKVKLLINHLNDSGYFKLNKFNSELYVDQNAFKNAQSKKIIEASSIKKDNIIIPQDRIPLKTKKSKEELEKDIKEWNYYLLSKSLSLNTTISFIDNNSSSNGYYVHIDYKNKIISYGYSIYYNVPDGVIQIINKEIITEKQNIAIILKTAGVGTIFFFLEEVYGKEAANVIRSEIYEKYKVELERASNVETLAFLYDNLPNYIKLGYDDKEDVERKPYKLPDELLWEHLEIFVNYDNGSKDASFYVLKVMSLITPKFLIHKFRSNQSLVIKIYNGLDDKNSLDEFFGIYDFSETFNNGSNTYKPSNKDYFVTLLNSYIQLYENDKEVAVFETSGAHFHQGTKKGGKYDVEVKFTLDSNIVSSDEYKNKVKIHNKWESKQYLGIAYDSHGRTHDWFEYGRGYNESGYYNPLDVVKFTQYNDKGEALTINAPAIFVKYASDIKEWEKVNEGIRFGTNVVMIIAGVATIATGTGSLLLYAAIADIGLASTDIIIQSKKDEAYFKSKQGKEFLESWEKIYTIGGVVTFSPVAVKAVVTYGPKIVSSGADLLQVTGKTVTNPEIYKKVKDLTTKAIHSLEIPNFNKSGLEILKKGFTEFVELKNAKKLQNLGVIFVKGGEDTVAAIYKGVVIASGKVKNVSRQLFKALNKLNSKNLEKYLDELLKWKSYKSLIGSGGLIKYKKVLSRNMVGQEKGMACAAACIEQLTIDYNIAKKYSQFDIFDLAEAGIEFGMSEVQLERALIRIFGENNVKSGTYLKYIGHDYKIIAKEAAKDGPWIANVFDESMHAIIIEKIVDNNVFIRDPWPLEGIRGVESGKPGVEAILDLEYFSNIWQKAGAVKFHIKQ